PDMGHQKPDFGRREELARALPRPFSELAEEVLVGAPEKVWRNVGQAQAIARIRKRLDHSTELRRVDVALAVALGGEIDHINHARERGVVLHDEAHGFREVLADVLRSFVWWPIEFRSPADRRPSSLRRQLEAEKRVV